ncbi:MAG: phosphoglycerate kinase [Candidatus Bipolaricaulota bacterium]|nr:phosphoglycerate kinase [Candidatus Bipolaricaulota bacterium]
MDKPRRVQDAEVTDKTVLVRVDYNVPLKDGAVEEDSRIEASLPTLSLLLKNGGKVVLLSHLGRPKGKIVPGLSLDAVGEELGRILARPVEKLDDCVGAEVELAVRKGGPGDVFLLENLRFHPEEEDNEPGFSSRLAALGDIYVNDAFATLHRAHASTLGITEWLPAYAGVLVQKEVEILSRLVENPPHPYLAVIGGKKAKSKIGTLNELINRVDTVLIGGGVAFTFLKAKGYPVGNSIVDESLIDEVRGLIKAAEKQEVEILLPKDVVIAQGLNASSETSNCRADKIPSGWMGVDIGPETIHEFSGRIGQARAVIWAGPMGAFEFEPFVNGTREIAAAMARTAAFTVVGGGETGEAVSKLGFKDAMSYISTGGGATLSFLRGKPLPALDALLT